MPNNAGRPHMACPVLLIEFLNKEALIWLNILCCLPANNVSFDNSCDPPANAVWLRIHWPHSSPHAEFALGGLSS